MHLFVISFVV